MPTIQEIRQKYPQYQDMSDVDLAGALHKKYYSDMPYDQFSAKIGLKADTDEVPQDAPKREPYTGMILPWATDEDGNHSLAVPRLVSGMIDSAKDAVTAPYRAYTGELRMTDETGRTSPEAIAEGFNMATWASPTSIASGTGKQIARNAALEAAKRPPSEGAIVAQAARDIGVTLPRAVTSDKASVQQMGKIVANVPIAGQPLRKASKTAIEQLDDAARKVQDDLGTGDRLLAGERVRAGLRQYSDDVLQGRIQSMEDDLAKSMDPSKLSPLANTRALVEKIQKERMTRATSKPSKAVAEVEEAISRDGLTFEGLRAKRAEIRRLRDIDPDDLTQGGYDAAELDRLYRSLTDDLKAAAKNAGGDEALEKFNKTVAAEAKIAEERSALTKVLGRNLSDEALADKLFRMAGDKSTANANDLMRVRNALNNVSPETWDEVSSSVLNRIGRDPEGRFTPERFSTAWGKLSDDGKRMLFQGETRKALDDIAAVSARFKKMNEYANPSGSGMTLAGSSYFAGAWLDPTTTVASLLGANATARFLAKPTTAKAMADYAKAYEAAAKVPGSATQNVLAKKAQALALIAANGNERAASNLAARLATVQQTAAQEEGGEEIRSPEGNPEAQKATQEFSDAFNQGRAF